tara:strand:- start:50 stop:400 length:351 start_codon:yes stop_codon:yes gene_type:complete
MLTKQFEDPDTHIAKASQSYTQSFNHYSYIPNTPSMLPGTSIALERIKNLSATITSFTFWHRFIKNGLRIAYRRNLDRTLVDTQPYQFISYYCRTVEGDSKINELVTLHWQIFRAM